MAINALTIPVTVALITTGCGQLYYAIRLKKRFPKEHNFHNSWFSFFLWLTAGIMYPFYYSVNNARIVWFQSLSIFFICIFTPFMIFLILYYQYQRVVKKNPSIKQKRNINTFLEEYDERNEGKEYTLKTDLHRKALHLFPAAVIIGLWVFAVYIWDGILNQDQVWGISGEDYGRFLILTAGFSGIIVFAALDFVRLSYIFENRNIYHLLPDNVSDLLGKAMKRKEIFEFTKPASLVLALAPVFIFPFGVFAAAMLIATISDGCASVCGMKLGKRLHFPKESSKTIPGYLAGFFSAFGITIGSLLIFEPQLQLDKILVIAVAGAIVFFVIDLLSLEVDDNMLNPLFCAIVMGFMFYFL